MTKPGVGGMTVLFAPCRRTYTKQPTHRQNGVNVSIRRLAIALLCSGILPAAAATPDAAAIRRIVDRAVQPLMKQHGVPGMAVAVTVDGKALFFNYGLAATAPAKPVTEHTLFELGSISKTFTATLASDAEARGKLSLGDHPGKYLPALQGSALDKATLLDLGTYTAGGLPLQVPEKVEDEAQLLAWLGTWQPDAAPGTQRLYSNPSIGLLGRIAATALHTDFRDALERALFPRLGLHHTAIRVPAAAMPDYAWGHDDQGKPVRVSPGTLDAESYGVKSSAADMVRYLQANIDPASLDKATRRAIEGTHIGYYAVGTMVQGLGWEQYRGPLTMQRLLDGNAANMIHDANPVQKLTPTPAPPGTLFNKTGSTRGFGAYAAFVPQQRIGIVMLANKNYPIPARVAAGYAILDAIASITRQDSTTR